MNTLIKSNNQNEIEITQAEFVEYFFKVDNGKRFSFEGRDYLIPIYNSSESNIVIMSSRQAEKSTLLANTILLRSMLNQMTSALYVSSRKSQVDDFVRLRINPQFDNNPMLKKMYISNKRTNRISDKVLNNGVNLMFRSLGLHAVAIRGISTQELYFDEVQSIEENNIPIALECTHSFTDKARFFFAGTPQSSKNHFTRLFNTTTQYEWIIKCNKCGKYNDPLGIQHIDLKKPFLFCQHCGKNMDPQHGEMGSSKSIFFNTRISYYASYDTKCTMENQSRRWNP